MDTALLHDPRTKQQIKDAIYDFLYDPVLKQFASRLEVIINKNDLLNGSTKQCFSYKGVVYSAPNAEYVQKKDRLAPPLHSTMDAYVAELRHLNAYEIPYVIGFISQALNASNDIQDHLRILPDEVHRPIEQLIATCPCKSSKLTNNAVDAIRYANKTSIDLMRRRLIINLLI